MMAAQVRSKVARAKNDLRTLATGLEAFHVDNRAYPEVLPPPGEIELGGAWLLKPLTTPVAYLSSLPADPFPPVEPEPLMPPEGRKTYHYTSSPIPPEPAKIWSVSSNGPDLLLRHLGHLQGLDARPLLRRRPAPDRLGALRPDQRHHQPRRHIPGTGFHHAVTRRRAPCSLQRKVIP